MKRIVSYLSLVFLIGSLHLAAQQQPASPQTTGNSTEASKPKDPLENMRFRNLGPAVGGGRATAVVGIPGKPGVYYAGTAGGGIFLTQDGGFTWKPIFEHEATASIGAIALAPSNPSLIWVGTGEKNIRNDVITGKGVYFSSDAGTTWKFMGLRDAGQISNIVIDPQDPNTVFVAVLGHAWGPNVDRGIFRTTDGGKNWQKVLYVDEDTGASSLVMEPGNPMVLFAGMWHVRRYPWALESGGTSSGIFRSTDGGNTWTKLKEGLPQDAIGRVGLAAAPSNPKHVYALVENKRGTLYDTSDGGDHWRMVSNNHNLDARPFYFSEMVVSPKDDQKVYFLSFGVVLSEDGGRTSRTISGRVHPDHHSMWIDPQDPDRIIDGNDGGVYVSSDAGSTWRYLDNIPIEQFYSVAQDDETPYNLCGGLQDNNAWCGPSNSLGRGGISGNDWFTVTGGDGEYAVPSRGVGTHLVYTDSQNGSISRLNVENGMGSSIRPYLQGVTAMKPADLKYRFNWTSPIAVSYTNPNEVYIGGSALFKTTDGGVHWTAISPDLTRNDKSKQETSGGPIWYDISGAETFDCILAISISPLDPNVIWVGTDDGVVQMTKDGGAHWTNVTGNITGLPQWGRLQQIEASPNDVNSAYIAVDFHEVDNNKPYVFKTHDGGKSWTAINAGLPQDDPARVIREDPGHKGFLVLGTDTSLFASHDDGAHWTQLKSNFPTASVYDIKFAKSPNQATRDLVIATHGRGLFVLDDLSPMEQSGSDLTKVADVQLYPVPPAVNWHTWNRRGFSADGFVAPNPPIGAVITYFLPTEIRTPGAGGPGGADAFAGGFGGGGRGGRGGQGGGGGAQAGGGGQGGGAGFAGGFGGRREPPVKITISDSSGQVIHTISGTGHYGINRVVWNMRYDGPKRLALEGNGPNPEGGEFFFDFGGGPQALPGSYKVALTVNGKTQTQNLEIQTDPRFKYDIADLKAQFSLAMEMRDEVSALNTALNRLNSLHRQITGMEEMLALEEGPDGQPSPTYRTVLQDARALDRKVTAMMTPLYNTEIQRGGQDDIHYLQRFHDRLQGAMRSVSGGSGEALKETQLEEAAAVKKELQNVLQQFNTFVTTEVADFNKKATQSGTTTLFAGGPVEMKPGASATTASAGGDNQDDNTTGDPDDPDGPGSLR